MKKTPCLACAASTTESCLPCQLQPEDYLAVKDLWLAQHHEHLQISETVPVEWAIMETPHTVVARWNASAFQWQSLEALGNETPGAPSLRFLWLEITTHCPHQCRHCYMGDRLNQGHVALPMVQAALLDAPAWTPAEIVVTGGEPTMHPDFATIVRQSLDTAPQVRVLTNGWTHRAEVIQVLAHPRVSVEIPLLGTESVHDDMTQTPRSYARIRGNIRQYVDAGVQVTLTTTVTRQTLPTLPILQDWAHELGIAFAPTSLSPQGRAADHWEDLRVPS